MNKREVVDMIRKRRAVFPLLLAAIFCIPGCKPSEKTEASIPVVSGKETVQTVQSFDLSLIYGTEWENGLATISISKDGKVHNEALEGENGEAFLDSSGNTALDHIYEGYVDGGYVIWVDRTDYLNEIEQRWEGDRSVRYIKVRGGENKHQLIKLDVITYVSDRTLILDNTVYLRKK